LGSDFSSLPFPARCWGCHCQSSDSRD
jgi:hypothetical protein